MDIGNLLAQMNTVALRVDHDVVPDLEPPRDYRGPHLIVIVHAGRLVSITRAGHTVVDVSTARIRQLTALGLAATEEPHVEDGVDTAIARPVTTLRLHVEDVQTDREHLSRIQINHYAPALLGPRWSDLVHALHDAAAPRPDIEADLWDMAMLWTAPSDLGERWAAGRPTALPRPVTGFEHDGPVYVRAGRPPDRSELYRLHDDELVHLPERGGRLEVERRPLPWQSPGQSRWVLPCGAGVVTVMWGAPSRIIIRSYLPHRSIAVQRG